MISRLAASVYPEYSRVYRLMTGRETHENYLCIKSATVKSINDGVARIVTSGGRVTEVRGRNERGIFIFSLAII